MVPVSFILVLGKASFGNMGFPSKNDRGFIQKSIDSARGHYLRPSGQLLFGRSVSSLLASKVTQSFTSKGDPRNAKLIVCTARQGQKI